MIGKSLDDRLARVATLKQADLRSEYSRTFGTMAPELGRKLLALALAHRYQEKAMGALSAASKRELTRLSAQLDRDGEIASDVASSFKIGTRLVRNWHGVSHHVLICEEGYQYNDRHYRSLSQIAREITGAAWSGPRFFGLLPGSRGDRGRGVSHC